MPSCRHLWRPYADQKRIWQECDKCGLVEHVTTHREQLANTLGYVMGSLHEPPSSSSTARSESGGGTTPRQVEATPEILWDQLMDRDARIRVLEAQLGVLQTLAESRGDEAMLIILRAGR